MERTINQADFLADLQELVAIHSTKALSGAGMPFGPGPREALDKMLAFGARDGFRTKNIDGYAGYIEYGPEDAAQYIAVLGHVDVVPATGKWTSDPFVVRLEDGTLYGRGVIDDKGPTMAAYYGLKALKASGAPLKHRIRLVIGTDEESGCECMSYYNAHEPMALFGFAPDAEFPLIYAEKGRIALRLDVAGTRENDAPLRLRSFHSGTRVNMVPDHAESLVSGSEAAYCAESVLAALRMAGRTVSADALADGNWKITVKGQSAHGSEPQSGVNAAFLLAGALVKFPFADGAKTFLKLLAETLADDFDGQRLGIACSDSISGKLTVNAGIAEFKETAGGSVSLDIRCPVKASLDQINKTLTQAADALKLRIGGQTRSEPLYVDPAHPGVQILKHVYEQHTGQQHVELLTSGGGTYAQYLDAGVAFGACMPSYPYTGHQVDEHVPLDDLLLAGQIYADALAQLGNLEH
ncbi:MAG: dipeptidase PepV [Sporolactobacillus sp.]